MIVKRSKILMIGDSVYPDTMGGSHRHIHDISKLLAIKGYDVAVFSPMQKGVTSEREEIDGFTIYRYKKRKNKVFSLLDFLVNPYILFLRYVKTNGYPDIIHGHWPLTCILVFFYCRLRKTPSRLVYTFHGPCFEEYNLELEGSGIIKKIFIRFVRIVERAVIEKCDAVQTASNYMKEKLINLYNCKEKVSVNRLFVDLDNFKICTNEANRPIVFVPGYKYVFVLRRLKKRMGIQLLLEAIAIVIKSHPEIKLLIGGQGDYKEYLERLAYELGINNHVTFLGFLPEEELKYYYSFSDVSVVPSLDLEGFGLATVESMACGTPVVATNICANTEIVGNITANLLTSFDAEMMGQAIIKGVEMKQDLRYKLREYVETNFNPQGNIYRYEKMYAI